MMSSLLLLSFFLATLAGLATCLAVAEQGEEEQQPSRSPLICCMAMFKNEVEGVAATIASALPYCDTWAVLDTGSTDGTQDAVRQAFGALPGKLYEAPFVDFSTSRNHLLDLQEQDDDIPLPTFNLVLDAHDTLQHGASLQEWAWKNRDAQDGGAFVMMSQEGEMTGGVCRFFRAGQGLRFEGSVHEHIFREGAMVISEGMDGCNAYILHDRSKDSGRTAARRLWDIEMLEKDKEEKPSSSRTAYYLARTYAKTGFLGEAIAEYKRFQHLGQHQTELFHSLLSLGKLYKALEDNDTFQRYMLEAYAYSKGTRAEPMMLLAKHYLGLAQQGNAAMGLVGEIFAKQCIAVPPPTGFPLEIAPDAYTHTCPSIMAQLLKGRGMQKESACYAAMAEAITSQPLGLGEQEPRPPFVTECLLWQKTGAI